MSALKFPEFSNDYAFPSFEEKILKFWSQQNIFARTLEQSKDKKTFYFYDGPPFATGLPHYGHIIGSMIKDIVPRYWTMRGHHVSRRFGWDCHGLPVEFEMEKTLNLNGSLDIVDYGVGKFNEACRGIVLRYAGEWRKSIERMGRWVDMDNDYKTMNPSFMESVWWVFKELWNKGLIYEGKKVVPYSWRLTAPLSNFEASQNYKDVQDPAITVLLPLKTGRWTDGKTALAIWTTTPWTLPSNLAVAVHTDFAKVAYGRYVLPTPIGNVTHVIMSQARAEAYGLKERSENVAGADMLGWHYEPFFTCFDDADRAADKAFRVLDGSKFVSAEDGTGLVHMAPSFGEDDYYACLEAKIRPVDPTDMQAQFTDEVTRDPRLKEIKGLFVKDADKAIIKLLKEAGRLMKQDVLQHAYPFCERSDTPLIYKAISSWFVKVESIREEMQKNNQSIHWVPEHIKDGRFGNWLANARDWCISRNRFWGTPIPVWRCESCKEFHVVGSREELDSLAGRHVEDLHKHFVDDIVADCPKCKAPKSLKRTPEVLDCWFESGSMPYAQEHYPFENKEKLEKSFPADFIAEGLDQTRGWFYTLTVLSSALFQKPAFKNCIVNGIVLAEDGRKMSKRLKNYPDPAEIFNKYGADALRLYLMQSPALHGEELRFSEKNLVELMRAVMIPLWNAYGFFASYANIDELSPDAIAAVAQNSKAELSTLDEWILARGLETEAEIHRRMQSYKLSEVAPLLVDLIDDLTNWYIRLNRDRFWSDGAGESARSKEAAYATLWQTLDRLAKLLAPSLPFLAEVFHAALRGVDPDHLAPNTKFASVHETQYATVETEISAQNRALLNRVGLAKKLILLGRALRGEAKLGLRQPLPKLRVAGLSREQLEDLAQLKDLVCKEVNVKELELVAKASDLVEESVKPNHRVMGKKVGADLKDIQADLARWGSKEISLFERAGLAVLRGHTLKPEDLQIVRKAKPGKLAQAAYGLVAELDTTLSPALIREGLQRELINRIQQRRKELKLHLADRIRVRWHAPAGSVVEEILNTESAMPGLVAAETLTLAFENSKVELTAKEELAHSGAFSFDIEKA